MKQHIFFNAGGETATEQTEPIIDVVKVIANVFTNLWTSAPQKSRETSRGRGRGRSDMRAEACILEQHFWRWR